MRTQADIAVAVNHIAHEKEEKKKDTSDLSITTRAIVIDHRLSHSLASASVYSVRGRNARRVRATPSAFQAGIIAIGVRAFSLLLVFLLFCLLFLPL